MDRLDKENHLTNGNQEPEERLILIDTDAGTDDAWALFLALAFHKASATTGVRIVGITTTCGNAKVEDVSINVTRILDVAGETQIPVYQGMSEYLMKPFSHFEDPPYHGEDGFGDANLPPITPRLEEEHAVNAIIRLADLYKGRLILVGLGPLTNLAMAVKLKPEIKNQIKEVYLLGGNMDALGNVTPAAEFNFMVDAEATAITIDSYLPLQITILPWETCLNKAKSTYEFRTELLASLNTPEMTLLNAIEATNLDKYRTHWLPPDAPLIACAINPNIIRTIEEHYAQIEVVGTKTRGMMVVDKAKILGSTPPNVKLITDLDKDAYESYLIWAAGGPQAMLNGLKAKLELSI